MIDKPLYENPLGGGQQGPFDLSKIDKNPYNTEFIGIGADQTNLFGYKVPDYIIKEQEERMKNNPINMFNVSLPGELGTELTPLNPVPGAQQATPSTPNTESFSQDVLRDSDGNPLPNFTPIRSPGLPPSDPTGLQEAIRTVDPIVTGPQEIATQDATNPYNRVGQQLTGPGFNQSNDILETLQNIEKGIASLGQGNMNQSSFGGFNNNFGIGSFFPPYGGMYG